MDAKYGTRLEDLHLEDIPPPVPPSFNPNNTDYHHHHTNNNNGKKRTATTIAELAHLKAKDFVNLNHAQHTVINKDYLCTSDIFNRLLLTEFTLPLYDYAEEEGYASLQNNNNNEVDTPAVKEDESHNTSGAEQQAIGKTNSTAGKSKTTKSPDSDDGSDAILSEAESDGSEGEEEENNEVQQFLKKINPHAVKNHEHTSSKARRKNHAATGQHDEAYLQEQQSMQEALLAIQHTLTYDSIYSTGYTERYTAVMEDHRQQENKKENEVEKALASYARELGYLPSPSPLLASDTTMQAYLDQTLHPQRYINNNNNSSRCEDIHDDEGENRMEKELEKESQNRLVFKTLLEEKMNYLLSGELKNAQDALKETLGIGMQ
ncbi:hypothetical protein AGDE_15361 [Angomonas deanei]|uniref:Uncharacterized protein n=1 Tax=Angomonas deanei TaxID=59799 RepID=A0A7G2CB23_9TRYP|nr:hypothetical protein AGDE_15361 [Angomonas deanei]CAD2216104.1 hypothetical protein, conserved [Angomonas deanei]|eukprot:EPY19213.1 hypothetical protein AGDE_15361 [Angomonas deanei]